MKTLQSISGDIANLLNCSSGGSCGIFARWVTKIAVANNITNFRIVFGYVKMYTHVEHIWIEHDGKKIDPTVAQFAPSFQGYAPGRRKSYTPQQFLSMNNFSLKNKTRGQSVIVRHLRKA